MPGPHRLLTMRNPLIRTVVLVIMALAVMTVTLRSDNINVSTKIMKSTPSKHSDSERPPTDWSRPPASKAATILPNHGNDDAPGSSHIMNCDIDIPHLTRLQQRYRLDEKLQYLKRYVKFSRQPIQRKSLTKLQQDFLPKKFKTVDLKQQYDAETCPEPLNVPVTQSGFPATANASDFMFAVSTTYRRFNESQTSSLDEWSFWLTDNNGYSNGGKLILLLLDATEEQLSDASTRLRNLGIDADVHHSDSKMEMAVRYLTLVPTLYNHPERKNKKWLVTCDDDTYFPSLHALIKKFSTLDHTAPMYVGTLSEDVNAIDRHGSQAFGGAGVFLSVPMAAKVTQMYETCKSDEKIRESNTGWGPQGDILLRKCIYENSEVRLSTVWDLWQLDLYGDPSGFYESGIKPLSLHHYKGGGWHLAHPFEYTKIAHACGEDCSLQRFQTADDFVLSTGFSVAHYPSGIDVNLDQMERTFSAAPEDKGWNLDFMFGPQRRALHKTGRKISWDLQEAVYNEDGSVLQVYIRRKDDWRWVDEDGEPMSKIDGLIELVWIP
jgi:hypothetical protein